RPKLSGSAAPLTPETAAALVAAARAAGAKPVSSPPSPPAGKPNAQAATGAHGTVPLRQHDAGYSAFSTPMVARVPAPAATTTLLLPPDAPPRLVPASALQQPLPPVAAPPPPSAYAQPAGRQVPPRDQASTPAQAPPRFWPAKTP